MFRYIKHKDIDTEKWDHCISQAPNGLIYACSWYLDTVCGEWDALVQGDYETVFPITHNSKFGIRYLARPYGTQQLGLFSLTPITKEMVKEALEAIPHHFRFIDIFLNTHNSLDVSPAYQLIPNTNYELDLSRSYEQIYNSYSTNTKRNLKKSKQFRLSILSSDQPELLIHLFRNNKGKDIKNLQDHHYDLMRRLMYLCIYKKAGQLWTVYDEHNSICAGAFFMQMNDRIILLFSATDSYGRESKAMTYLLDEFFIYTSNRPLIFDFEGSNIPNLARFYKGFGAEKKEYLQVRINQLPWLLKAGLNLFRKLRG